MRHAIRIVPPTGQDRAAVIARPDRTIVVLADGAGGTGNGALAANAIVNAVRTAPEDAWGDLLVDLDGDHRRLGGGEATAVILTIDASGIYGASVGDSGAWLIGGDIEDLTANQERKPLVGGGASPIPFRAGPLAGGTLLVASDGLLRYARPTDIAALARGPDLELAARALVDLVRLPSGELQDDVSVVLCRE